MINILLADDDLDDCLLFTEALNELKLKTILTCMYDGEELINCLNGEKGKNFQILFLDLNMPLKNGLECLKEIKQNHQYDNLPVIIFTTSYDKKVADQLYLYGAQYYACKPSNFFHLKRVIEYILNLLTPGITKQLKTVQPVKDNFYIQ
jgi:CheY-like chemotaxis protein